MENSSAELVLLRLVAIIGVLKFLDERHMFEVVGFHEIIQRVAEVTQLGIDQTHEQVRVHLEAGGKIHAAEVANPDRFVKSLGAAAFPLWGSLGPRIEIQRPLQPPRKIAIGR